MSDPDRTRQSLLARLRDPRDGDAWAEFVDIYTSFVYGFVRRRGLQSADASDVTQDVMRTVFSSLDGFQHEQRPGSFRSWLVTIARRRLSDFLSRQSRQVAGTGDTGMINKLSEHPAIDDEDADLALEYQRCVFEWAARKIRNEFRNSTWRAFWRSYVDGDSCDAVARETGMSREAVYMARSRVLSRLRSKILEVEK